MTRFMPTASMRGLSDHDDGSRRKRRRRKLLPSCSSNPSPKSLATPLNDNPYVIPYRGMLFAVVAKTDLMLLTLEVEVRLSAQQEEELRMQVHALPGAFQEDQPFYNWTQVADTLAIPRRQQHDEEPRRQGPELDRYGNNIIQTLAIIPVQAFTPISLSAGQRYTLYITTPHCGACLENTVYALDKTDEVAESDAHFEVLVGAGVTQPLPDPPTTWDRTALTDPQFAGVLHYASGCAVSEQEPRRRISTTAEFRFLFSDRQQVNLDRIVKETLTISLSIDGLELGESETQPAEYTGLCPLAWPNGCTAVAMTTRQPMSHWDDLSGDDLLFAVYSPATINAIVESIQTKLGEEAHVVYLGRQSVQAEYQMRLVGIPRGIQMDLIQQDYFMDTTERFLREALDREADDSNLVAVKSVSVDDQRFLTTGRRRRLSESSSSLLVSGIIQGTTFADVSVSFGKTLESLLSRQSEQYLDALVLNQLLPGPINQGQRGLYFEGLASVQPVRLTDQAIVATTGPTRSGSRVAMIASCTVVGVVLVLVVVAALVCGWCRRRRGSSSRRGKNVRQDESKTTKDCSSSWSTPRRRQQDRYDEDQDDNDMSSVALRAIEEKVQFYCGNQEGDEISATAESVTGWTRSFVDGDEDVILVRDLDSNDELEEDDDNDMSSVVFRAIQEKVQFYCNEEEKKSVGMLTNDGESSSGINTDGVGSATGSWSFNPWTDSEKQKMQQLGRAPVPPATRHARESPQNERSISEHASRDTVSEVSGESADTLETEAANENDETIWSFNAWTCGEEDPCDAEEEVIEDFSQNNDATLSEASLPVLLSPSQQDSATGQKSATVLCDPVSLKRGAGTTSSKSTEPAASAVKSRKEGSNQSSALSGTSSPEAEQQLSGNEDNYPRISGHSAREASGTPVNEDLSCQTPAPRRETKVPTSKSFVPPPSRPSASDVEKASNNVPNAASPRRSVSGDSSIVPLAARIKRSFSNRDRGLTRPERSKCGSDISPRPPTRARSFTLARKRLPSSEYVNQHRKSDAKIESSGDESEPLEADPNPRKQALSSSTPARALRENGRAVIHQVGSAEERCAVQASAGPKSSGTRRQETACRGAKSPRQSSQCLVPDRCLNDITTSPGSIRLSSGARPASDRHGTCTSPNPSSPAGCLGRAIQSSPQHRSSFASRGSAVNTPRTDSGIVSYLERRHGDAGDCTTPPMNTPGPKLGTLRCSGNSIGVRKGKETTSTQVSELPPTAGSTTCSSLKSSVSPSPSRRLQQHAARSPEVCSDQCYSKPLRRQCDTRSKQFESDPSWAKEASPSPVTNIATSDRKPARNSRGRASSTVEQPEPSGSVRQLARGFEHPNTPSSAFVVSSRSIGDTRDEVQDRASFSSPRMQLAPSIFFDTPPCQRHQDADDRRQPLSRSSGSEKLRDRGVGRLSPDKIECFSRQSGKTAETGRVASASDAGTAGQQYQARAKSNIRNTPKAPDAGGNGFTRERAKSTVIRAPTITNQRSPTSNQVPLTSPQYQLRRQNEYAGSSEQDSDIRHKYTPQHSRSSKREKSVSSQSRPIDATIGSTAAAKSRPRRQLPIIPNLDGDIIDFSAPRARNTEWPSVSSRHANAIPDLMTAGQHQAKDKKYVHPSSKRLAVAGRQAGAATPDSKPMSSENHVARSRGRVKRSTR